MTIPSFSSSSPEISGPYLNWIRPVLFLAAGLGLLLPVILWASWMEPEGLLRFSPGWNNLFLGLAVMFFAILLLLAPLVWMTIWRSLDVIGLTLAHQGLILLGYFFIERTAASLGVAEWAAVQEGLPWIVMINLVGFSILLSVLAVSYAWDRKQGYHLKPLPAPAEDLDRRLIPFLRILAVILCGLIVLPMCMTGALPMIGGGEGEDVRYQMLSSSSSRPLYHFATGLVPVVAGALSVSILRRWRRFPVHDGVLLLLMTGLQVVSGNRLPLVIALFMTVTLVTMQS